MAGAHNRARYVKGCRCDVCKRASRDYARERRARQREQQPTATVTALPAVPAAGPGDVEVGVRAELAQLGLDESRPGLFHAALALARVLDNRGATPQHAAAAGRLTDILEKAGNRKGRRGKSNLAALREAQ